MSKNDKKAAPKARKLEFTKKKIRKLEDQSLAKVDGGRPTDSGVSGGGCPSGFRCCFVNHNQALRG